MSTRNYISLGIMTGTSLDGADLSVIKSNGNKNIEFLDGTTYIFSNQLKDCIKNILGSQKRDSIIDHVETIYTDFIIRKIKLFLNKSKYKIDLIGFHGQTITHKPNKNFTWQIGNARKIFDYFKIPIVYNFRKNDILNGGNGAPLTPIFHDLLRAKYKFKNLIFINLGGISNLTISTKENLLSFDSGPCCSLSNDFIKLKINKEFDNKGKLASRGRPDNEMVKKLINHRYFKLMPPKSLDRLDIGINELIRLNLCDGLATINEFIAMTIVLGLRKYLKKNSTIVFSGGGRKNDDLLERIQNKLNHKILTTEDIKLNGDLLESYAFAYLAIRSINKKPISFPKTTGVLKSITGGELIDYTIL